MRHIVVVDDMEHAAAGNHDIARMELAVALADRDALIGGHGMRKERGRRQGEAESGNPANGFGGFLNQILTPLCCHRDRRATTLTNP